MEVKVYETLGGKVLDFLLGFFILGGLFESMPPLFSKLMGPDSLTAILVAAGVVGLALSIYLYKRRKFIGIGFGVATIGGPLAVFLTYLLLGLSMGSR